MKVPDVFIPEKILENKVKQFLKNQTPQEHDSAYKKIEFGVRDKYFHFFDASLALLKEKGYERHPYSWESFGLIIANLENKLPENLNKLAEEMLQCGEWFSMAFERKKNKLICYRDPENIRWDNNTGNYVVNPILLFSDKKEFNIRNIPSGKWVDLKIFSNSFVEYFYTRKFEDLPEQIKNEAQIILPPEGFLCPIGTGFKKTSMSCDYSNRASRGIHTIRY